MENKSKVIACSWFNSEDLKGRRVKNYLWAFDDGTVTLNRIRLVEREPYPNEVVLCKKFGKTLVCEGISLKYMSAMTIASFAHKHLYSPLKEGEQNG